MHIETIGAHRESCAGSPTAPFMTARRVRVDGATLVEAAGFRSTPGAESAGRDRLPAPARPSLDTAGAAGASFFGEAINETTPLLGGTAEAGSLVLVSVGGAIFCVTADDQGSWTLDTAVHTPMVGRFDLGADGTKDLLITSVDSLGNSCGISGTFVLDTTPPQPPALDTSIVERATPLLRGSAEARSTVTVGVCGAVFCLQADVAGRWYLNLRDMPPVSGVLAFGSDGPCNVALASTDAAGNSSTAEGVFLLQSSAPQRAAGEAVLQARLAGAADATRRLLAGFGSGLRAVRH